MLKKNQTNKKLVKFNGDNLAVNTASFNLLENNYAYLHLLNMHMKIISPHKLVNGQYKNKYCIVIIKVYFDKVLSTQFQRLEVLKSNL